jgi:hypothetical protein
MSISFTEKNAAAGERILIKSGTFYYWEPRKPDSFIHFSTG